MADLLFIIVVVGFFGLMVLLVEACDHIIGPDQPVDDSERTAVSPAIEEVTSR